MKRNGDERERDPRPEKAPERERREGEREKRPDAALGRKPASFSGNEDRDRDRDR
jgi:hypothetical protein